MKDSDPAATRDGQNPKKLFDKTWVQLVGVTGAIILFVLVAGLLLDWYISPENSKAKRDLVQALALITAGVAGAFGIYFTWRGQRITREGLQLTRADLESTQKDTAQQLHLTQQELHLTERGQITERFTRAIDQLGSKELEIRLGGIYALERIARDSEQDHWPIMEVLTAYVRQHARERPMREGQEEEAVEKQSEEDLRGKVEPTEVRTLAPDIQAILTVLGRRARSPREPERLDLHETDLRGAILVRANLSGAELSGAGLSEAQLLSADLSVVGLAGADLSRANLLGAKLFGASLVEANLFGADLSVTDLSGATLSRADLSRAYLGDANLFGANLSGAKLSSARLSGANLRNADLSEAHLTQAQLEETSGNGSTLLPSNLKPPAHWDVKTDEQIEGE